MVGAQYLEEASSLPEGAHARIIGCSNIPTIEAYKLGGDLGPCEAPR